MMMRGSVGGGIGSGNKPKQAAAMEEEERQRRAKEKDAADVKRNDELQRFMDDLRFEWGRKGNR